MLNTQENQVAREALPTGETDQRDYLVLNGTVSCLLVSQVEGDCLLNRQAKRMDHRSTHRPH